MNLTITFFLSFALVLLLEHSQADILDIHKISLPSFLQNDSLLFGLKLSFRN